MNASLLAVLRDKYKFHAFYPKIKRNFIDFQEIKNTILSSHLLVQHDHIECDILIEPY